MGIQFLATGSYLPGDVVTNEDLAQFLDTSDEWITTRTGIKTRHIAKGETTSDLAVEAARAALSGSGLDPEQIGLVICATVSPDISVPMIAAKVKRALGIENAAAFDLNANCSSFVYTTTTAYSLMQPACCLETARARPCLPKPTRRAFWQHTWTASSTGKTLYTAPTSCTKRRFLIRIRSKRCGRGRIRSK